MSGLFVAEVRKLTTVRTTWVITLLGVVFVLIGSGFVLFETALSGPFGGTDAEVAATLEQIGGMSVIAVIVGLLSMTTEFRHGTVGRTFQLVPSRTRVMLAKLAVGAAYGVAFFVVALPGVAVLLAIAGAGVDGGLELGRDTLGALWRGPVGLALAAVFGVAIGALLRNQVVAITVTLIYVFVGEQVVNTFAPEVARWMPFQALQALYLSEEAMAGLPEGMVTPLDPAVALPLFLGYVALAAVPAVMLMRYRDV